MQIIKQPGNKVNIDETQGMKLLSQLETSPPLSITDSSSKQKN